MKMIVYEGRCFKLVPFQGGSICNTCDAQELCVDHTIKNEISLCLYFDTISMHEELTNWKEIPVIEGLIRTEEILFLGVDLAEEGKDISVEQIVKAEAV